MLQAPSEGSTGSVFLGPWFHIYVTPLLLLAIGVYARRLGRRDGDDSPRQNDLAVSTSVLLMTFGAIAADAQSVTEDAQLLGILAWLVVFLCLTFASIDHDRYNSWERLADGSVSRGKKLWTGIILPDLVSVLMFSMYQAMKVR